MPLRLSDCLIRVRVEPGAPDTDTAMLKLRDATSWMVAHCSRHRGPRPRGRQSTRGPCRGRTAALSAATALHAATGGGPPHRAPCPGGHARWEYCSVDCEIRLPGRRGDARAGSLVTLKGSESVRAEERRGPRGDPDRPSGPGRPARMVRFASTGVPARAQKGEAAWFARGGGGRGSYQQKG